MLNLAIFYGGKSVEHDISIITAIQVMKNLDKDKYNITPIYVDENNNWSVLDNYLDMNIYANKKYKGIMLACGMDKGYLIKKSVVGYKKYRKIDVAINCMHGLNGEDGTLAGLLELNNIAYVGSGVLASSIGMDKVIQKDVLKTNNLPVVNYMYFLKKDYTDNKEDILNKIEDKINYPIVVKPANLGSSIGINISKNRKELQKNIEIALNFDKKIIIEEKINNLREINCSVIGGNNYVETSVLEEPKNWETFLDFNEKYLNNGQNKKEINVKLGDGIDDKIKDLSIKVFKLFGASGVARIDYLLDDKTKEIYINEINTVPGSFANYLWKDKYTFSGLLDKLIDLAIEEYEYKNVYKYTYKTDVLKATSFNKIGNKQGKF